MTRNVVSKAGIKVIITKLKFEKFPEMRKNWGVKCNQKIIVGGKTWLVKFHNEES